MEDLNNFEEPFQNNNQEPNSNTISEPFQNNFQVQTSISTNNQNNIQSQNNFPEPYQNNIPEPYQNNIPEPYQNNIPEPYQNKNQEPSQNNNPEPCQNNLNNLNRGIANNKLKNKKMIKMKIIYFIIMSIIFISELVLYYIAIPMFDKDNPFNKDYEHGETGMYTPGFLLAIYPLLIMFSSSILCLSCGEKIPIFRIIFIILLCIGKGLLTITFFNDDFKSVTPIGITLEILNFFYMVTSVTYHIILIKYIWLKLI